MLSKYADINLSMHHRANEEPGYNVTSCLIGWVPTQNDPCIWHHYATYIETWYLKLNPMHPLDDKCDVNLISGFIDPIPPYFHD